MLAAKSFTKSEEEPYSGAVHSFLYIRRSLRHQGRDQRFHDGSADNACLEWMA
jgi:hypothetical protein